MLTKPIASVGVKIDTEALELAGVQCLNPTWCDKGRMRAKNTLPRTSWNPADTLSILAPDGWNLDRLAQPLRGMPGVAVRAGAGDFVEVEVEATNDDTEAASLVPANLVFEVAHDVAAATFKFMHHAGERMDLAELVDEVDAAISA